MSTPTYIPSSARADLDDLDHHRDDVTVAGKPGRLLARLRSDALVKFASGAVAWVPSAQVPMTAAELATYHHALAAGRRLRGGVQPAYLGVDHGAAAGDLTGVSRGGES